MGQAVKQEKVVLFLDTMMPDSQKLQESFRLSGCDFPTVVMEETGFGSKDVQSVFGYFLGDYAGASHLPGKPLYFNQISVPDYWEITSSNVSGTIRDLYRERGRIFYRKPTNKRIVKTVDWLDEQGKVRWSDHYNQYGAVFARTTIGPEGKPVLKTYFSPEGKEVITENLITRDIVLNQGDRVQIFNGRAEFAVYFFRMTGLDQYRIFFNSLSTPFFVSCSLGGENREDVLFWQERVEKEIPGNMQIILRGEAPRVKKIYVQKESAYRRLIELGASPERIERKGFVYPFNRENQGRSTVLICTNSDQISHCEKIAAALPQVDFRIAALTEMSPKLMQMEKYENVHLYPCIRSARVNPLFGECDLYLDINQGGEILSAVQRAFLHNQLILGFSNTLHDPDYVDGNNVFDPDQPDRLIAELRRITENPELLREKVQAQQKAALTENPESFLRMTEAG